MTFIILLLILTPSSLVFAKKNKLPLCSPTLRAGTQCILPIKKLSPTQPTVGMHEMKKKMKEFEALDKEGLKELKHKKIVPVLIGPDGKYYLIDHHHTALALWEMGEETCEIEVLANWTKKFKKEPLPDRMKLFWKHLTQKGNAFLYREDGTLADPFAEDFPQTLQECKNNRYRSLASSLIDDGFFEKPENVPYFEFKIAEALRNMGLNVHDEEDYKEVLKEAKKLLKGKKGAEVIARLQDCSPFDIRNLLRRK